MTDYLSVSFVCLSACLSNWRLTDWLTDWQTSAALVTDCRLPNWLNDCGKITHWLSDWRSLIEWLTERLSVCLSVWLMNLTDHVPTDCPLTAECLTYDSWFTVHFQTDWPTDWLTDWMTDQPADRPTDWLTDWLTYWLTNWLTISNSKSLLCLTL